MSGGGFPAGSHLLVTLFSSPVQIGTAIADSSGRYAVSVVIPATTAPGGHTIVVGTTNGAVQTETAITVTAAVTATTATTLPALSFTGANIRGPATIALLLVLAGIASIVGTIRRRPDLWPRSPLRGR